MKEIKDENISNQSLLINYPLPISLENTEIIVKQMKNNIFRLCRNDGVKGTCFSCKILVPNKNIVLPVLITSNHVLDEIYINKEKSIILEINKKIKVINLNNKRKIYSNKEYDTTIIEIRENDEINNFLEIDENIFTENSNVTYLKNSIYILHYSLNKEASVSYGILDYFDTLDNYKFTHLCNTLEGASGSPIINSLNNKIIGIHKGGYTHNNYISGVGIFLKNAINDYILKNNFENNIDNIIKNINKIIDIKDEIVKNKNKEESFQIKDNYLINNKIKLNKKNNKVKNFNKSLIDIKKNNNNYLLDIKPIEKNKEIHKDNNYNNNNKNKIVNHKNNIPVKVANLNANNSKNKNNIIFKGNNMHYIDKIINNIFSKNIKIEETDKERLIEEFIKEVKEGKDDILKYCLKYLKINVLPIFKRNDIDKDILDVVKYNISTILECLGIKDNCFNSNKNIDSENKNIILFKSQAVLKNVNKKFGKESFAIYNDYFEKICNEYNINP